MGYLQNLKNLVEIQLNEPSSKEQIFENVVLDAVDQAFLKLGTEVKQAIYFLFETEYKLYRCNIPKNVDCFSSALEQIFGVGAKVIEIEIIKEIHQKLPAFKCRVDGYFGFELYMNRLRIFIED